jgi:hypothetical protein
MRLSINRLTPLKKIIIKINWAAGPFCWELAYVIQPEAPESRHHEWPESRSGAVDAQSHRLH